MMNLTKEKLDEYRARGVDPETDPICICLMKIGEGLRTFDALLAEAMAGLSEEQRAVVVACVAPPRPTKAAIEKAAGVLRMLISVNDDAAPYQIRELRHAASEAEIGIR